MGKQDAIRNTKEPKKISAKSVKKDKSNRKEKAVETRGSLRIRIFFSLSIFIIIIAASLIGSAGIGLLNASGVIDGMSSETYANMMMIMVFSVLIGGILTFIWSHIILIPVCTFIDATNTIASGEYNVNVEFEKLPSNMLGLQLNKLEDSFNHMANELNSTEMFRKDFISSFSHEFKTPIISICGFAEQIYKGDLTPEQQKEYARIIMEESSKLAALSTNVLTLTKLENQNIVSGKTEYRLDEQLRNCVIRYEEMWSKKNQNIDIQLDNVRYFQNMEMMSMLWNNLISNAVKYTPPNGKITIRCSKVPDSKRIVVTIKDNGIGMDEQTKNKIFERFYQHDNSHKTEGNGLGLSIAWRIIKLIDADIRVDSEVGMGSTFTVYLQE